MKRKLWAAVVWVGMSGLGGAQDFEIPNHVAQTAGQFKKDREHREYMNAVYARKARETQVAEARKCGLPDPEKATEEEVGRCQKIWGLGLDPVTASRWEVLSAERRRAEAESAQYRQTRAVNLGMDPSSSYEELFDKVRRTYILALNSVGAELAEDTPMPAVRPHLTDERRAAVAKKLGWGTIAHTVVWDRLIVEIARKGLPK
ncbi:MAG: hypothetical protein HY553_08900 [Elusimicrobia bacterium]|nr:hypothetical protein [Elusimicrobiota bacterium]